jgi:hypothetical protein
MRACLYSALYFYSGSACLFWAGATYVLRTVNLALPAALLSYYGGIKTRVAHFDAVACVGVLTTGGAVLCMLG